MNMLSIYEANIFQTLCFMFSCKISITPNILMIYTDKNLLTNTHCTPLEPHLNHTIDESILNLSKVSMDFIYGIRFSPNAPQQQISNRLRCLKP